MGNCNSQGEESGVGVGANLEKPFQNARIIINWGVSSYTEMGAYSGQSYRSVASRFED